MSYRNISLPVGPLGRYWRETWVIDIFLFPWSAGPILKRSMSYRNISLPVGPLGRYWRETGTAPTPRAGLHCGTDSTGLGPDNGQHVCSPSAQSNQIHIACLYMHSWWVAFHGHFLSLFWLFCVVHRWESSRFIQIFYFPDFFFWIWPPSH